MRGALLSVVLCAACVACVGDSPKPGPAEADGGAAGTDSGPPGASTSLVSNGGFEDGCTGWSSSSASLTADATARSGAKSCKLCFDGREGGYFFHAFFGADVKPGQRYTVRAWTRAADGASVGQSTLISLVGIDATESPIDGEGASASGPVLTSSSWSEASAVMDVSKDTTKKIRIDVGVQLGAAGQCILVDDLVVTRDR